MDFLNYVPKGARDHATWYLEGDKSRGWEGWLNGLEKQKALIAEIDKTHQAYLKSSLSDDDKEQKLSECRIRKQEAQKYHDDLASDIATIQRLIHDARMKDAYQILTNAFFDDEDSERQRKFDGFIYAAWSARLDFSPYRERLKQAAELRDKIAETADKLADLLDQVGETGVLCPDEFFSIPSLLRNTDNHSENNRNLTMWRGMRDYVLGDDPPQREITDSEQTKIDPTDSPEFVFKIVAMDKKPDIDPEEEMRNTLHYAWRTAPPLPVLLKTVSKAANEFIPSEDNFIGEAIGSRKKNIKAQYLRAFGNLLTKEHCFILTTDMMKAMATTATVVINLPDIDVSYDDARKALAKLGGDSMEDSRAK
jgi:hypothetical protein